MEELRFIFKLMKTGKSDPLPFIIHVIHYFLMVENVDENNVRIFTFYHKNMDCPLFCMGCMI